MARTRHRVLRFGERWVDCALSGVAAGGDGDLSIASGIISGTVEVNGVDAGEDSSWRRVVVDASAPDRTRVRVEVAAADVPAPPSLDFHSVESLEFWLPSVLGEPGGEDAPQAQRERWRFLWLRLTLETQVVGVSPSVHQIRTQTQGEDYIAELPAFYAEDDAANGFFLQRLLEWLGSNFGDNERAISDLARRIDPAFAAPEDLAWLAEWLGWEDLPEALPVERMRELVEGLYALNRVRGTLPGLAAIIRTFMGIDVRIVEHFRHRPSWVLGERELGLDSGLSRPGDGWVVPGEACEWEVSEQAPLTVGDAVVGTQGPLERSEFGAPLFDDDAHRFSVFVPPGALCCDADIQRLRALIDREKPAHTDYHLCVLDGMRLGRADHVGVSAYIGHAHRPEPLGSGQLGMNTYVQDRPNTLRLGVHDRITDSPTTDRGTP